MSGKIQRNYPATHILDGTGNVNKLHIHPDGGILAHQHDAHAAMQDRLFAFSANFNATPGSTETPMFLIRNPSGSGKILRFTTLRAILTNTVGALVIIRMYSAPTVSANGSSVTIGRRHIGGTGASPVALVTSGPTVSANGNRITSAIVVSGTAGGAGDFEDFQGGLILAENQALLITGTPDGTNRATEISVAWEEMSA